MFGGLSEAQLCDLGAGGEIDLKGGGAVGLVIAAGAVTVFVVAGHADDAVFHAPIDVVVTRIPIVLKGCIL